MTCDAASRPAAMNSVRVDRRTPPLATLASNRSALFRKAEATVRLVPTGVLSSWATPATSLPSAASFSVCTRLSCAVRRSSSDCDNCLVRSCTSVNSRVFSMAMTA